MNKTLLFLLSFLIFSINIVHSQNYQPLSRQDSAVLRDYNKNYSLYDSLKSKKDASYYLNKIAFLYWEHNQNNEAINYYKKSLILNMKLGNENGISMINNNLGLLYSDTKQYEKSLACFKKTLAYRLSAKRKQKDGLISVLMSLSVVLDNLKRYSEAVSYLERALEFAKEKNDPERMQSCYGMLSELYSKTNNVEKYEHYFRMYREYNNALQKSAKQKYEEQKFKAANSENARLKKEIELMKETEKRVSTEKKLEVSKGVSRSLLKNLTKKELEIEVVKKDAQIKELNDKQEIERRKKLNVRITIIAIFMVIVSIISILAYRQKRKVNKKLAFQNIEIYQQREEIIQQRDSLGEAKKLIEDKNKHITQSLDVAKLIQTAMLNKIIPLSEYFPESFIYYKPRDIVSGDFYWYSKLGDEIIVAAVDCTGHGVPGAFLSMVGNDLLHRIVESEKISDPATIIYEMDKGIKIALNQEHTDNDDGMDAAVCTINLKKRTLEFAGAKNPLVLIQDRKLQIIAGSGFSIGGFEIKKTKKKFKTTKIKLSDESRIYLFSDGYNDQMNTSSVKFLMKRFNEMLLNIYDKPFDIQKKLLHAAHSKWRGSEMQIDDIVVIGIKLG